MTRPLPRIAALSLFAILFGIALRLFISFTVYRYFIDDAYIFMRFAENFASGNGLVYNPGERVIGYSSPLFQIFLACVKFLFRGISTSLLLSIINYALFAAGIWFSMRLFAHRKFLCAVPLLLLLYFPYIDSSLGGMETMAMLAAMLYALDLLAEEKHGPAIVVATLSFLLRPEGLFFLAAVGLYTIVKGRRLYWKSMLIGAALLGTWIVGTYSYFGSVLPQSMLAKSAHVTKAAWGGIETSVWDKGLLLAFGFSDSRYADWSATVKLALMIAFLAGAAVLCFSLIRNLREKSFLAVMPAFYLLIWAFYVVGHPIRIFSWYTIPTSLCFIIGVLDGLGRMAARLKWQIPQPVVLGLCGLGCLGVAALSFPARATYMMQNLPEMERFARYVASIPGANSILLGDIGLVGYISGLRVIDSVGLVSPVVFELAAGGRIGFLSDLIDREKPSVVCLETDPVEGQIIKQSERRYQTFRDQTEADWFHGHYQRLEIPAGRYAFVFVEKRLMNADNLPPQIVPR